MSKMSALIPLLNYICVEGRERGLLMTFPIELTSTAVATTDDDDFPNQTSPRRPSDPADTP